jgi:hypothetical protein
MMNLKLERRHGTEKFTHGTLSIDGVFFCDTIEDQEREEKIKGQTAIPCGTYKVTVDMSIRFKRYMPLLHNVPNFTGVRIHNGNTDKDTEGCILVGKYLYEGFITNSRDTFQELMKRINAVRAKESITIEII